MRWVVWVILAGVLAGVASAGAAGARVHAGEVVAPPGRTVHVATKTYRFDYAYPAAAGRIAGLKAWLDADLDKSRADLAFDALNAAALERDGAIFNPWNQSHDWQVVTDLPGWLSLSGNDEDYEGGAHPTYSNRALLWDKAAQRERRVFNLFVTKAAFNAVVGKAFCAAYAHNRAKRLRAAAGVVGTPTLSPAGAVYPCGVGIGEVVVMLGSSDHAHFDRIGFTAAVPDPYYGHDDGADYNDDDFDITIPVTAEMIAAVRPEYRAAFAVGR